MSEDSFVSPVTRLEAALSKATKRPSADMDGAREPPPLGSELPCVPSEATLARSVLGVHPSTGFPLAIQRSRTKISVWLFVSPATRLDARLSKATKRPSAETDTGASSPPEQASPS